MSGNLYSLIASRFPADRTAACLETPAGEPFSWAELERRTAQAANLLVGRGLRPGDRVLAQVEKSPAALFLYLGALRAGLVFVPLNTAYREAETDYFLENAAPGAVVFLPERESWFTEAAKRHGGVAAWTLDGQGGGSFADKAAKQSSEFTDVPRANDDLACILYTSGTTGRSKGAMLSHGNLSSNAQTLHAWWDWLEDDVLLHALPIFHVHGLFVAVHGALLAGAKMIWMSKWDAPEAARQLRRCTVFMGVPTMYVRLLAEPSFGREACAGMRLFISGSAPLLVETFREFQARTGHTILERYGMSETVMITSNACRPADGPRVAGTVGAALPGVSIRVVGEENSPRTEGEVGDVQVRGPNVFSGYWRAPEKTAQDFTSDGWFKTGDVGRLGGPSADGTPAPANYLTIVGRSKDLIITGGYNVYPKEIEGFLDEMPGVAESAVFGVPDPDFGEAVCAAVVPRAGATLDGESLTAAMRARIAKFKAPKQVHVVAELPRNAMGKVQKNVLRQTYGG